MLEDTFEALTLFPATVEFRFVEAGSVVSQTCIPQIEGHRTALRVSLPVPSQVLPRIRETLQLAPGQWY
jgi:hypothetical protein